MNNKELIEILKKKGVADEDIHEHITFFDSKINNYENSDVIYISELKKDLDLDTHTIYDILDKYEEAGILKYCFQ